MGQVISANVWVGSTFVAEGTPRESVPADVVDSVGSHLWKEAEQSSSVTADGDATVGLKANVWIGDTFYEKGTIPPASVIPLVGAHLWVDGYTPPTVVVDAPPQVPGSGVFEVPVDAPATPRNVLTQDDPIVPDPEPADPDFGTPEAPEKVGADSQAPVAVPPKSGPGSSKSAWSEYARSLGVDIEAGADRADIIANLEDAGFATE